MTREGTKFRSRKIDPRKAIQVLLNTELSKLGEDTGIARSLPEVATGVDKEEEKEHHLQAAISSHAAAYTSGSAKIVYIPTPDARQVVSNERVQSLYKKNYAFPSSYVCFSAQVEDCMDCHYNADETDVAWFSKNAPTGMSVIDFERLMSALEAIADERGIATYFSCSETLPKASEVLPSLEDVSSVLFPYIQYTTPNQARTSALNTAINPLTSLSSLSSSTTKNQQNSTSTQDLPEENEFVLSTDTISKKTPWEVVNHSLYNVPPGNLVMSELPSTVPPQLKDFLPVTYKWWVSRRQIARFKSITPVLRINELGPKAEADAYVCFRRRDIKPQRKTRRSELQAAAHSVKIRNDLACARALALLTLQREVLKKETCDVEKELLQKQLEEVDKTRKHTKGEGTPIRLNAVHNLKPFNSFLGQQTHANNGDSPEAYKAREAALSLVKEAIALRTTKDKSNIPQLGFSGSNFTPFHPAGIASYSSLYSQALPSNYGGPHSVNSTDGVRKGSSVLGRPSFNKTHDGTFTTSRGGSSHFMTPSHHQNSKKGTFTSISGHSCKIGKSKLNSGTGSRRAAYVPPTIPELPILSQGTRIQGPAFRTCTMRDFKKIMVDCGMEREEQQRSAESLITVDREEEEYIKNEVVEQDLGIVPAAHRYLACGNKCAQVSHQSSYVQEKVEPTDMPCSAAISDNLEAVWPPPQVSEKDRKLYAQNARQCISQAYEQDLLRQGFNETQLIEVYLNLRNQLLSRNAHDYTHFASCIETICNHSLGAVESRPSY